MKQAIVFPMSLVLVAMACVAVCLTTRVQHPRAVTLVDGSKLEYLGSTVGANSSFDYGSAWQKLVARLPDRWKQKLGGTAQNTVVKAGYFGDSNIVFWFVRRNKGGGTAG